MVGAIIGDLAAWTWEHDKNSFYKKLIMAEAVHSHLCEEMLLTANLLMRQKDMDYETYSRHFKSTNQTATILRAITIGWLYDTEQETRSAYQNYCLSDDKEDWYAGAFMCPSVIIKAISRVRQFSANIIGEDFEETRRYLEGTNAFKDGDEYILRF